MQDLKQAINRFIKIRRKILRTYHYCSSFVFELPGMIITFSGEAFVDKLKWKGLAGEFVEGLQEMGILDQFLNIFDITERKIDSHILQMLHIACCLSLQMELVDGIYLQDGRIKDKRKDVKHIHIGMGLFPVSVQLLEEQETNIILHSPYIPMLSASYVNAIEAALPRIRKEILKYEVELV